MLLAGWGKDYATRHFNSRIGMDVNLEWIDAVVPGALLLHVRQHRPGDNSALCCLESLIYLGALFWQVSVCSCSCQSVEDPL
jgi:hypothetical protein